MALYVYTNDADALLNELRNAIKFNMVATWEIDVDGDYLYTPEQWTELAWIRCGEIVANGDRMVKIPFGIVTRKNQPLPKVVYGVYMGRFAEMLSTHLDDYFDRLEITAQLVKKVDVF